MHLFIDILRNSILITGLVVVMMMMIESLNIESKGLIFKGLRKTKIGQVIFGALLGSVPGCMGGFATVSLYTHRMFSFGALIAMMIASSGDEAFVMLAMIPDKALMIFTILFVVAVVTGILTDVIGDRLHARQCDKEDHSECEKESDCTEGYVVHESGCPHHYEKEAGTGKEELTSGRRHYGWKRISMFIGLAVFIAALATGKLGHDHSAHGGHSSECTHVHAEGCTHDHNRDCTQEHHRDSTCGHHKDYTHDHHEDCTHDHNRDCTQEHHGDSTQGRHEDCSQGHHEDCTHDHHIDCTQEHHGDCSQEHHRDCTQEHHKDAEGISAGHVHNDDLNEEEQGRLTFNLLSEDWMNVMFAGLSILVLFVLLFASDHFVEEHLWNHIVRKHLLTIFGWTFGVLLVVGVGLQYINIDEWISDNTALMIVLATLIGIIPESGPHMIFVTLYAAGVVPLPVLLASSISQDGHASLPLIAESRKSFLWAKVINCIVALLVGFGSMLI